jgi:hypothetical protein
LFDGGGDGVFVGPAEVGEGDGEGVGGGRIGGDFKVAVGLEFGGDAVAEFECNAVGIGQDGAGGSGLERAAVES